MLLSLVITHHMGIAFSGVCLFVLKKDKLILLSSQVCGDIVHGRPLYALNVVSKGQELKIKVRDG